MVRKLTVSRRRDYWAYEESMRTDGGEYSVVHEGIFADLVESDEIEVMVKNYYVKDLGYYIAKKKKKKNRHIYLLGERK